MTTPSEQLRQEMKSCFDTFNYECGDGDDEVDCLLEILDREKKAAVEEFISKVQKNLDIMDFDSYDAEEQVIMDEVVQCFRDATDEMFPDKP